MATKAKPKKQETPSSASNTTKIKRTPVRAVCADCIVRLNRNNRSDVLRQYCNQCASVRLPKQQSFLDRLIGWFKCN